MAGYLEMAGQGFCKGMDVMMRGAKAVEHGIGNMAGGFVKGCQDAWRSDAEQLANPEQKINLGAEGTHHYENVKSNPNEFYKRTTRNKVSLGETPCSHTAQMDALKQFRQNMGAC